MKKIVVLEKSDILLFTPSETSQGPGDNQLKNFLSFLRYIGTRPPINFSHVSETGALLSNLTVKDNIMLDAVPTGLSKNREFHFKEYLADQKNTYLATILDMLPELTVMPNDLDAKSKKLVTILKSLLNESTFIFLESPESHLDSKALSIVKNALSFEANIKNRTVLLSTAKPSLWMDVITKTVKRARPHGFEITDYTPNLKLLEPSASQQDAAPSTSRKTDHEKVA